MFEIGWTEMLVIAIVMIVVVGPKDLPKMLRTFGRTTSKLRSMAGDFQRQFNEALKEAELDDVKKTVDGLRSPMGEIRKQLNPFEQAAADVRSGLDSALKPSAPKPADPAVHPAEPLKNGATGMPEMPGPSEMPPAPLMTAAPPVEAAAPKPAEKAARPATAKAADAKPAASKAAGAKPAKAAAETAVRGPKVLAKSKRNGAAS